MYFRNLSESPATLYSPDWQRKIVHDISNNPEYDAAAIEADNAFKKFLDQFIGDSRLGYYAAAALKAFNNTPRYSYIKNIHVDGKIYEAEIDLLLHGVSFEVVDNE